MWFLKKHKAHASYKDAAAQWIASKIIRVQSLIATKLSSWEQKLSNKGKMFLLIVFVAICASYFIYLLKESFTTPVTQRQAITRPQTIKPLIATPLKQGLDSSATVH